MHSIKRFHHQIQMNKNSLSSVEYFTQPSIHSYVCHICFGAIQSTSITQYGKSEVQQIYPIFRVVHIVFHEYGLERAKILCK